MRMKVIALTVDKDLPPRALHRHAIKAPQGKRLVAGVVMLDSGVAEEFAVRDGIVEFRIAGTIGRTRYAYLHAVFEEIQGGDDQGQ